jgi:lipopolysaccharide export LptBFGC system permease protein LptF
MNWSWETHRWKNSMKIGVGLATIWPPIYMVLFFLVIFLIVGLTLAAEDKSDRNAVEIDLLQLEHKIRDGDLKQLTITRDKIVAWDRAGRQYRTSVTTDSTRDEILEEARAHDENGRARVDKIDENTSVSKPGTFFTVGFVGLFAAHLFTILLTIVLMPLYIILAVKNDYIDQTMKIMWAVLICMVGMFAMPVYWYLYIWRNQPPAATLPKPS